MFMRARECTKTADLSYSLFGEASFFECIRWWEITILASFALARRRSRKSTCRSKDADRRTHHIESKSIAGFWVVLFTRPKPTFHTQ